MEWARHTATRVTHSPWSPFRRAPFTVIWLATLVSNIGSWMYSSASALLTDLARDDLVSVAISITTLSRNQALARTTDRLIASEAESRAGTQHCRIPRA